MQYPLSPIGDNTRRAHKPRNPSVKQRTESVDKSGGGKESSLRTLPGDSTTPDLPSCASEVAVVFVRPVEWKCKPRQQRLDRVNGVKEPCRFVGTVDVQEPSLPNASQLNADQTTKDGVQ